MLMMLLKLPQIQMYDYFETSKSTCISFFAVELYNDPYVPKMGVTQTLKMTYIGIKVYIKRKCKDTTEISIGNCGIHQQKFRNYFVSSFLEMER